MVDLFFNKILPVLTMGWIVGGALLFAFVIGLRLAPGPVKVEGTDELADKKQLSKQDLTYMASALFLLVSGFWLRSGADPKLKGGFLVCVGVAATVFVVRALWPEIRRRRPPLEPADDEQPVEGQSEFEAWAQKEAAADVELTRFRPSHPTTHRDNAGNLICRIRFARTDGEAIFIAERDPEGINRIHVRSVGKNQIHVRSVRFPRVGS